MAEKILVTIGEERHELDVDQIFGSDKPGIEIAGLGELLGDAEAERVTCEGLYRKWRAGQGNAFRKRDKSLPEWRVKQRIEAQDEYLRYKQAEAACERNVTILRNLICGLLARARVTDPNARCNQEE